jgi:hypothetical protein
MAKGRIIAMTFSFRSHLTLMGLLCICSLDTQAVGNVGSWQVKSPTPGKADLVAQLKAKEWQLVQIAYSDGKEIRPKGQEKMTAVFGKDGRVTGRAGVNRFTGSYKAGKNGVLSIGKLTTTHASNPPGSIADSYVKVLPTAKLYLFNKGKLVLCFPYDTGEIVFKPAP